MSTSAEDEAMTENTANISLGADGSKSSSAGAGEGGEAGLSALRDNIATKGRHAYYYAHSHKANGPAWDGKPGKYVSDRMHICEYIAVID